MTHSNTKCEKLPLQAAQYNCERSHNIRKLTEGPFDIATDIFEENDIILKRQCLPAAMIAFNPHRVLTPKWRPLALALLQAAPAHLPSYNY